MPRATFEESTEIILDDEKVSLGKGWADVASISDIFRQGALVTLALRVKNTARAAWAEKSKYALGAVATEGGKTYILIKAEPEAEKAKPTTDAGVHWEEIATPTRVCTLPAEFRPAAEITGTNFTIATTGVVSWTGSLTLSEVHTVEANFRSSVSTP